MNMVHSSAAWQRCLYFCVSLIPVYIISSLFSKIMSEPLSLENGEITILSIGTTAFLLLVISGILARSRQRLAAKLALIPQIPLCLIGLYVTVLDLGGYAKRASDQIALAVFLLLSVIVWLSTALSLYVLLKSDSRARQ
jgi:hypothetical protein